jgi:Ca2+-binding RTX toxin-like protein
MTRWISRLRRFLASKVQALSCAVKSVPVMMEPLERKDFLSCQYNAGNELKITGGSSADSITVDVSAGYFTASGAGCDTSSWAESTVDIVVIEGLGGNDTLSIGSGVGAGKTSRLEGGDGNDTLNGGASSDTLIGGDGADAFNGGSGTDTADYGAKNVNLNITIDGSANDGASGETDNVKTDVENVIGGSANDSITGSSSTNDLSGADGNDTLDGGSGTGQDQLRCGAGSGDEAYYGNRTENLTLKPFDGNPDNEGYTGENDTIDGCENLTGGSGNDNITGSNSGGVLKGRAGNDSIEGGNGADSIFGHGGNDTLSGGAGNDTIFGDQGDSPAGTEGADSIYGGSGADSLFGDGGNDWFGSNNDGSNDTLNGGTGSDDLLDSDAGDTLTDMEPS